MKLWRRSKPRSGCLGYVVNIGSFVSTNRFVSTQGVNRELYRHRPPQKDYQCLRDEPRSKSAQAANPALPRTEADCGLLPTVGSVSGGGGGHGQLRVAVATLGTLGSASGIGPPEEAAGHRREQK